MIRALTGAVALALLGACASEPVRSVQTKMESLFKSSKGEPALAAGLKQYEEGEYASSAKNLRSAINQGLSNRDLVNAYKHLAFIDCASNRERQCRDGFRQALAIDPAMELAPAEAGHPVWGPIFRSLKAGR
jgi:Tfp pilus assembly protein PilF